MNRLVEKITAIVEKLPNLKLLILFGSRARGEHRQYEAILSQTNYRLVKRSELPEGATLLSSVWQMKRKRKP